MNEVGLELEPAPLPSSAFNGETAGVPRKARTHVEIEKIITALENGEAIDQFLTQDDHAMVYGMKHAHLYGMDSTLLNFAIMAHIQKWFAVLFFANDSGVGSVVEAAQNPYHAAVTMSSPSSRSKKPVTMLWVVKAIVGPFETQGDVTPVLAAWRSVRPQNRYEKTVDIAKHFRAKYFFGSIKDFQKK